MARYAVYCGPTLVHSLGDALSRCGENVTCRGTENVYVTTNSSQDELLATVNQVLRGFTTRDVQRLPD
jgi:hypothetical protein